MNNLFKLFVLFLLVSASFVGAKGKYGVIGKVYTAERALELYGPVQKSIEMDKSDLIAMLDQCENYMMFKIKNNEVVIADDNRNVLTSNKIYLTSSILTVVSRNDAISENEKLNLVSKNKVMDIINSENSDRVKFEIRETIQTISSTLMVLDFILQSR
ncbi:MAG: hypothetical protein KJ571_03850 [Bacteroidetes bacterium]|nr:hypothetical protein [Bacteroidota bacterium]